MNALDFSAEGFVGKQLHTAQTWGSKDILIKCDAVIVGAGPGGLTTAARLAELGLNVIVLEGGNYWTKGSFKRQQSWALRNLYQDQGTRVMQGNALIPVASGRGVGGGTLVNSGISFRAPDRILDRWEREWGLSHWADRERLYREVESMIGVGYTKADIAGVNSEVAKRGFQAMGVKHSYMPRNTPGCAGCGTCQTGCPAGGKASADLNWLPRALRAGAQVFTNCRVETIVMTSGRASGVTGTLRDFETNRVQGNVRISAPRVILAAGAINTALLLQTNNLANSSGWVGKNLHVQPGSAAVALMDEEVRIWSGATQGYFAFHPSEPDLLAETFSAPPEAFFAQIGDIGFESADFLRQLKNIAASGFLVRDESGGEFSAQKGGPPKMTYNINEADRRKFMTGMEYITEMFFAAGSRKVRPLIAHAKFFTSWNEARQFIRGTTDVAELMLYASHPMGSCRMGADPKNSVVRPDGRTHDHEGLYITDSSLHPTALGVNPQMTVMAHALALAPGIANAN